MGNAKPLKVEWALLFFQINPQIHHISLQGRWSFHQEVGLDRRGIKSLSGWQARVERESIQHFVCFSCLSH